MPFWRKSEDPWDMEPEKRRTWTAGEPQPPAADAFLSFATDISAHLPV